VKHTFWIAFGVVNIAVVGCTTQKPKNAEQSNVQATNTQQQRPARVDEHESRFEKYFSVHTKKQHIDEMEIAEAQRQAAIEMRKNKLNTQNLQPVPPPPSAANAPAASEMASSPTPVTSSMSTASNPTPKPSADLKK